MAPLWGRQASAAAPAPPAGQVAAGVGVGLASAAAITAVHYALQSAKARLRSPLGPSQWKSTLQEDGTVSDFAAVLELVADKGMDPDVRCVLWPYLLGVYAPAQTTADKETAYAHMHDTYAALIQACRALEAKFVDATSKHGRLPIPAPWSDDGAGSPSHSLPADERDAPSLAAMATLNSPAKPPSLGQLSRADVPQALHQYWEAQRIIAVDAVRTDLKKHAIRGSGLGLAALVANISSSIKERDVQPRDAHTPGTRESQQGLWFGRDSSGLRDSAAAAAAAVLPAPPGKDAPSGNAGATPSGMPPLAPAPSSGMGEVLSNWLSSKRKAFSEKVEGSTLYQAASRAAAAARQRRNSNADSAGCLSPPNGLISPPPGLVSPPSGLVSPPNGTLDTVVSEGLAAATAAPAPAVMDPDAEGIEGQELQPLASMTPMMPPDGIAAAAAMVGGGELLWPSQALDNAATPAGTPCRGTESQLPELLPSASPPVTPGSSPGTCGPCTDFAVTLRTHVAPEGSPLEQAPALHEVTDSAAALTVEAETPPPVPAEPATGASEPAVSASQADPSASAVVEPVRSSVAETPFQSASGSSAGRTTVWLSSIARFHLDHATHFTVPQRRQVERMVTMLSAYAVHDPEIGYCQGMSDLALPFLLLIEDDAVAFWCFEALMRKVRTSFVHHDSGIFGRLSALAQLLEALDPPLGEKLRALRADHCHFAYRMVMVLMRRELPLDQALRVWEQLWADDLLHALRSGADADGLELATLPGPGPTAPQPPPKEEPAPGPASSAAPAEEPAGTSADLAAAAGTTPAAPRRSCSADSICSDPATPMRPPSKRAIWPLSRSGSSDALAGEATQEGHREQEPEACSQSTPAHAVAPAAPAEVEDTGQQGHATDPRPPPGSAPRQLPPDAEAERLQCDTAATGAVEASDSSAVPLCGSSSGLGPDSAAAGAAAPEPDSAQAQAIAAAAGSAPSSNSGCAVDVSMLHDTASPQPADGPGGTGATAGDSILPPAAMTLGADVATAQTSSSEGASAEVPLPLPGAAAQAVAAPRAYASPYGDELFQFFVAVVVLSQRQRIIDECTEHDDVLRVFQSLPRIDVAACMKQAKAYRDKLLPVKPTSGAASTAAGC